MSWRTRKLLASELVTNALMHGQGKIAIRAELDENHLLVEVIDEGKGLTGSFASGTSTESADGGFSSWRR